MNFFNRFLRLSFKLFILASFACFISLYFHNNLQEKIIEFIAEYLLKKSEKNFKVSINGGKGVFPISYSCKSLTIMYENEIHKYEKALQISDLSFSVSRNLKSIDRININKLEVYNNLMGILSLFIKKSYKEEEPKKFVLPMKNIQINNIVIPYSLLYEVFNKPITGENIKKNDKKNRDIMGSIKLNDNNLNISLKDNTLNLDFYFKNIFKKPTYVISANINNSKEFEKLLDVNLGKTLNLSIDGSIDLETFNKNDLNYIASEILKGLRLLKINGVWTNNEEYALSSLKIKDKEFSILLKVDDKKKLFNILNFSGKINFVNLYNKISLSNFFVKTPKISIEGNNAFVETSDNALDIKTIISITLLNKNQNTKNKVIKIQNNKTTKARIHFLKKDNNFDLSLQNSKYQIFCNLKNFNKSIKYDISGRFLESKENYDFFQINFGKDLSFNLKGYLNRKNISINNAIVGLKFCKLQGIWTDNEKYYASFSKIHDKEFLSEIKINQFIDSMIFGGNIRIYDELNGINVTDFSIKSPKITIDGKKLALTLTNFDLINLDLKTIVSIKLADYENKINIASHIVKTNSILKGRAKLINTKNDKMFLPNDLETIFNIDLNKKSGNAKGAVNFQKKIGFYDFNCDFSSNGFDLNLKTNEKNKGDFIALSAFLKSKIEMGKILSNGKISILEQKTPISFSFIYDYQKNALEKYSLNGAINEIQWNIFRLRALCFEINNDKKNQIKGKIFTKRLSIQNLDFDDFLVNFSSANNLSNNKKILFFVKHQLIKKKAKLDLDGYFDLIFNKIGINKLYIGDKNRNLTLLDPFEVNLKKGQITPFKIRINKGLISCEGLSDKFKGKIEATKIPLSFFSLFFRDFISSGDIDLTADFFTKNFTNTGISISSSLKNLSISGFDEKTDPKWDMKFSILSDNILNKEYKIKGEIVKKIEKKSLIAKNVISNKIKYEILLSSKGIFGSIDGNLDLKLARTFLGEDRLLGELITKLKLRGTIERPTIFGTLKIKNAAYEKISTGTCIKNIDADLYSKDGRNWIIKSMTSNNKINNKNQIKNGNKDGNKDGNKASASGSIDILGAINIDIDLKELKIVEFEGLEIYATGKLSLNGPLNNFKTTGKVNLSPVTLNLDEFSDDDIPSFKKLNTISYLKTKNKAINKIKSSYFPIQISTKISKDFTIRGLGLDTKWGGDFDVAGSLLNSYLIGKLSLKNGHIEIFNKKFELENGNIIFDANKENDPKIHMKATKTIEDVKIIILLHGRSSNLKIKLMSHPTLSEESIVCYILFGKGIDKISSSEYAELLTAILSIKDPGSMNFVKTIQSKLKLDYIGILEKDGAGDKSQNFLRIMKDIGEGKLIIDKNIGTNNKDSRIGIEYPINNSLKAEFGVIVGSEEGKSFGADAGIGLEIRY